MISKIVLIFVIVIWTAANAASQVETPLSPRTGPTPEPIEPVDSSFVPEITSKVSSLSLISASREDPFIHIRLKNASEKRICSLRYAYHKNGQSVMLNFVLGEKPCLAPNEVYVAEYAFAPQSIFARQPVTFEAVLFDDGSGDGDPEKVTSLRDVFFRNRKELEHIIALLSAAIESPEIEVVTNLFTVLDKLSETPDYMYGVDLRGIAGVTLPSWKATSMHMIDEIKQAKFDGNTDSIRESIKKIKSEFEKTLARYPQVG
jgi:hypothetical protein